MKAPEEILDADKVKSLRFCKLANVRANKICELINNLGKLANKQNYSYTEEQVKEMFGAIEEQVRINKMKFSENKQYVNL